MGFTPETEAQTCLAITLHGWEDRRNCGHNFFQKIEKTVLFSLLSGLESGCVHGIRYIGPCAPTRRWSLGPKRHGGCLCNLFCQYRHLIVCNLTLKSRTYLLFCPKSREFAADLQDNISLSKQGDFPCFPKVGYLQKGP